MKVRMAGVEVWYWSAAAPAVGVLFLAHGMCHGAYDWFADDEISGGTGLAEERAIVAAARRRGYCCAAVSSSDRSAKAWAPEVDGPRVARALDALAGGLGGLPVYCLGASNGGAFALALTRYVALAGVCCMIMALPLPALEALAARAAFPRAVVFDHMPRDARTAAAVAANVALLRGLPGGPRVTELRIPAAPVDAALLARAGLPPAAAAAAARALEAGGFLDDRRGLRDDPRRSAWRRAVRPVLDAHGVTDTLVPDQSPLAEVMNVAFAAHEIAATNVDATLDAFAAAGS